uniref:Transposase MuDR plant domain-containing protein n=1 Tax=Fagus sylvatica TaxID=28930 RepID=A0A2N9J415_FAGSY
MDDDDIFIFEIHFEGRFKNLNGLTEKFVVLYTISATDVNDCIPLTPTLPEVLVVDKSRGKGKEGGTSNKSDKLPIIGGKNKNKGIKITDRQPPVKGKEKEVADRSKGKGKEKMFEVSVEKEYDVDDDVDCADFDNDNEVGLEVEDEDSELDLWDVLLSGDEDLLDAVVAAYSQGMTKAMREYNLKIEKDLSFVKNDKDKVILMCKNKHCNYRVYGSQVRDEMTFQIKTYNLNHTCTRAYKNSAINSRWIAERYMETFRHDIQKPTIALQQEIKGKWNVDVSRIQVYRARKRAAENIQGNVERPCLDVAATFQRLYVCLAATRTGFKEGCRPLIGLDGCFLKESYKGHLLSAVSRDANDNMYPICVAVVESECKVSWSWFLSTLLKDIGEGLTESFKEVCPDMDHRACVRHIYTNFRNSGHRGKALKDKLWAAASAYTEFEFDAYMVELKKLSPPAYEYLSKILVVTWSRVRKKSAVTVGARTSKKGVVTVGAGTSGQATACGRLSSAGGATGTAGATGTGTVARTVSAAGTGATTGIGAAVGTGAAAGGGASRKAKVVVVPTVEKVMTRIATKKQKKQ